MIINFSEIEQTVIPRFKGGEKNTISNMFIDSNNKIMRGRLEPGASIGLHTHETNSEIIYIIEGLGKTIYDGKTEDVCAGSCHYCPMGHEHSLINNSKKDLVFFAVVGEHK